MAQVLDLHPPADGAIREGSSHWRICWTSRGLAALFTLLLAAYGLFCAALILAFLIPFTGQYLGIGPTGMLVSSGRGLPAPYVPVDSLPLGQRLAHVPVGLLNALPVLFIFWNLRQLFRLYGRGVVFARENAVHLKWIGAWLVVNAAAPFLGVSFLRALHLAIDQKWMHGYSLQELVLGGIVYVITQVMQVGHEIEQDRSQFV
jgi:hypothetical protein